MLTFIQQLLKFTYFYFHFFFLSTFRLNKHQRYLFLSHVHKILRCLRFIKQLILNIVHIILIYLRFLKRLSLNFVQTILMYVSSLFQTIKSNAGTRYGNRCQNHRFLFLKYSLKKNPAFCAYNRDIQQDQTLSQL